ncbi:hypothetical protein B0H14DRAFT_2862395 [Mycena olivaceomarginata]|nr:hypothetical protein B0H14DRAFT_2862395 [Mycena olivaceomarginata]
MRCFAPKQVWVILVIILCRGEAFQAGCWQRAGSARAHLGQCTRYVSFIFKAGDELTSFFLILIFFARASFPILSGSQIWSPPNAVFLPDATIELGVERECAISSAFCALSKNFNSGRDARACCFTE